MCATIESRNLWAGGLLLNPSTTVAGHGAALPRLVRAPDRLACMEIRGGNRPGTYAAELAGLRAWVSCRPLEPAIQGGDLYYLTVCSNPFLSRVILADVEGHGDIVGLVAEHLRSALHEYANDRDQSAIIGRLNDGFLKGSDLGKYATAFFLSHDAESGEILFTNAGHVPPLWYRAASRRWSLLREETPDSRKMADLPLGIIPGTPYRQTAVQFEPADLLLLYTDGINEACDPRGEQLGLEGLLQLAGSLPVRSAAEAGEALVAAMARYRGSTPAEDDETVVALECIL
jgi:sigma-B regulation protein RsbU (phosphoserine phosphatase)